MVTPSSKRWHRDQTCRRMAADPIVWTAVSSASLDAPEKVRSWIADKLMKDFAANENQAKEYVARLDDEFIQKTIRLIKKNKRGY